MQGRNEKLDYRDDRISKRGWPGRGRAYCCGFFERFTPTVANPAQRVEKRYAEVRMVIVNLRIELDCIGRSGKL